jgi:hypothetical protein
MISKDMGQRNSAGQSASCSAVRVSDTAERASRGHNLLLLSSELAECSIEGSGAFAANSKIENCNTRRHSVNNRKRDVLHCKQESLGGHD